MRSACIHTGICGRGGPVCPEVERALWWWSYTQKIFQWLACSGAAALFHSDAAGSQVQARCSSASFITLRWYTHRMLGLERVVQQCQ